MSAWIWLVTILLVAGVAVWFWPTGARRRLSRVTAAPWTPLGAAPRRPMPAAPRRPMPAAPRRPVEAALRPPVVAAPSPSGASAPRHVPAGLPPLIVGASAAFLTRPRRSVAVIVIVAAVAGGTLGGPVAAGATGGYAALAARAAVRRVATRRRDAAHRRSLDQLCALAADLRAGLPPAGNDPLSTATSRPFEGAARRSPAGSGDMRLGELVAAVWRLAERTGAPAAELVERIEADARAGDRSRAAAAAQAAGARATALLLAGLPAGGIGLGYGIGVDPMHVLLHTPLGAACAVGAVALQAAGLAWADRLAGAGST